VGHAIVASIPEPPPPGLVPSCAEGGVLALPKRLGADSGERDHRSILGAPDIMVNRLLKPIAWRNALRIEGARIRCPDAVTIQRSPR